MLQPDRWKILMKLKENSKGLSYAELRSIFDENYNPNQLWRNLKELIDFGLVENVKRLEIDPQTHKARTSFYVLSHYGRYVIQNYLEEVVRASKKGT